MITVKHKGNFNNFERFCNKVLRRDYLNIISTYADIGVQKLRDATPSESGKTAESWGYEIESGDGITTVYFTNSNEENGVNIAILLLYGHGTKNGGYVEGNDFASPAVRSAFQDLADSMWREVTR